MTTHKQFAKFTYIDHEIEALIEWSDDGKELTTNFFNPNTGYTNSSNPSSVMNGWSYQSETDNYEIWNLINAIQNLTDWTDHLSWDDNDTTTFNFTWDGKSYTNDVMYYNDDQPIHYKELDLI